MGFVGVEVVLGGEPSWLLGCDIVLCGIGILSVGTDPEFFLDGLKGTDTGRTPGLVGWKARNDNNKTPIKIEHSTLGTFIWGSSGGREPKR